MVLGHSAKGFAWELHACYWVVLILVNRFWHLVCLHIVGVDDPSSFLINFLGLELGFIIQIRYCSLFVLGRVGPFAGTLLLKVGIWLLCHGAVLSWVCLLYIWTGEAYLIFMGLLWLLEIWFVDAAVELLMGLPLYSWRAAIGLLGQRPGRLGMRPSRLGFTLHLVDSVVPYLALLWIGIAVGCQGVGHPCGSCQAPIMLVMEFYFGWLVVSPGLALGPLMSPHLGYCNLYMMGLLWYFVWALDRSCSSWPSGLVFVVAVPRLLDMCSSGGNAPLVFIVRLSPPIAPPARLQLLSFSGDSRLRSSAPPTRSSSPPLRLPTPTDDLHSG
ncbi:hypothetical protein R6Q59_019338 [Mikania micrantha]